MFTRQHYIAIARQFSETFETLSLLPEKEEKEQREYLVATVQGFAVMFEMDNPNFKSSTFFDACKIAPSEIGLNSVEFSHLPKLS